MRKEGNQIFFDVFRREFREEKRKDLPRKVLQNAQNIFFLSERGLGLFIDILWLFGFWWPLVGTGSPLVVGESNSNISNPSFFPASALDAYLKAYPNSNWVDLGVLERFGCLVSKVLKKMKFQWSDQKLWPQEVSWHALHDFQDISTILTLILTYE